MEEEQLKARLLAENPEFRRLYDEHRGLEARLVEMAAKPFPTGDDRFLERDLKKRKLALKDRMYLLMKEAGKTG